MLCVQTAIDASRPRWNNETSRLTEPFRNLRPKRPMSIIAAARVVMATPDETVAS